MDFSISPVTTDEYRLTIQVDDPNSVDTVNYTSMQQYDISN